MTAADCPPWLTQLRYDVRRQLRAQRTTQSALAAHIGVTPQYMSQVLTGRVPGSPALLTRIAVAAGLSITVTAGDTEPVQLPRDARGRWLRRR